MALKNRKSLVVSTNDLFLLYFFSRQTNKELTEVLNQLWRLDTNRLKAGKDYRISLQVSAVRTHIEAK